MTNETEAHHPDDVAVDAFAAAMKSKLAKKRNDGKSGWRDECSTEFLSQMLREHVDKGDPVDVGNLAMMLQQRGDVITPDAQTARIAELDRAVLIETNHVDRLRKERDREKARAEAAEAKLAKADALAAECERAFDDVDGTGTQEFYLALYTYTDSRATLEELQKPIATRDDPA